MTRKIFAVMAFVLIAGFATTHLSAQGGPPQGGPGGPGQPGGGPPPPPPQTIDLATAKKMVAAAEAAGVMTIDGPAG